MLENIKKDHAEKRFLVRYPIFGKNLQNISKSIFYIVDRIQNVSSVIQGIFFMSYVIDVIKNLMFLIVRGGFIAPPPRIPITCLISKDCIMLIIN